MRNSGFRESVPLSSNPHKNCTNPRCPHTTVCLSSTDPPNGRRCRVPCWGAAGCDWVLSTSEAEELAGSEHRGEAAGEPWPQMVFHLLCFHTEPPSSRRWESALRFSSDPPGSVTAHHSLSCSLSSRCLTPALCTAFRAVVFLLIIPVLSVSSYLSPIRRNSITG